MSRRLTALVAAVLALAATVAPAGGAQPVPVAADLVLVRISPWVGPGAPLAYQVAVRNRGQAPLRDLVVDVSIGGPVATRSALAGALAAPPGAAAGRPIDSWRSAVPQVGPGTSATLEPRTVGLPPGQAAGNAGAVLPFAVRLQATGATGPVTARLSTFLVVLPGDAANRLQVALLVPVREPTHRNPAGVFVDDRLARDVAPGGPLGAVAAELARPRAPKVTLVVDALLAEEVAAMPGGWRLRQGTATTTVGPGDPRSRGAALFLRRLRAAAVANHPAAFPYAGADLPGLVQAGLDAEATVQVYQGRQLLGAALGTTPGEGLAWPVDGPIDAAVLRLLASTGARTVVLDAATLPTAAPTTQNATVDIGAGPSVPPQALVPDQGLAAALTDPRASGQPVAWAQRVLAETAVAWLERPNSPEPRGILLAPPQVWRPDPRFFLALVRGLAGAPWLTLEPAGTLAAQVRQGPDPGARPLAPVTPAAAAAALPRSYLRAVNDRRAKQASFLRTVGAGDGRESADFDHDLAVAESADWRPPVERERGRGFVRAVDRGISAVYAKVRVEPSRATLTARRGTIPVTVANAGSRRLTVVLRLTSPRVDLPATDLPVVLEPGRRTTQLVQVGTRTTGTFRVAVEVRTQDGAQHIATAEVTLVSTAFNRVALTLAGGAAGFLLLWWRRGRRRRAPVGRHAAGRPS